MIKGISFFGIFGFLISGISVASANSYDLSFGNDYVRSGSQYYEQGLVWAQWYMNLQKNDDYWVWKKPKLENYGILYHTDDDSIPAYIEYKITCGNNDCGSVVVNLDNTDARVPEGATFWKPNYENLQTGTKSKKVRLYRFGLLEQYIVGDNNLEVKSLDPKEVITSYDKISVFKNRVRDYKQANPNKQQATVSIDMMTQANVAAWMISPLSITATNVYIPWVSTVNCPSRTPCYAQFQDTYAGSTCYLWCSPDALSIIYGYYDRQWTYPNLISGVAVDISNTWNPVGTFFWVNAVIKTMANSIRTQLATSCISWQGGTIQSNIQYWIQYAKNMGYSTATSSYWTIANPSVTRTIVKWEVDAWRPVILSSTWPNQGHSFVAYWYSSDISSTMIRVNYGLTVNQDTSYFWRDVDAASVSLPAVWWAFSAYTKIKIQ